MSESNKKIIFWGSPQFALPSLKVCHALGLLNLVITKPDKPAGRGNTPLPTPIKEYALQNNIDFLQPESLDKEFMASLEKYLPATFLVIAYGKIIPQEVLDLSELRAINIHPSKLPILRGPSPIQTAILRGFENTAVSLMQLDEKMDHGPILGQIEVKIDPEDDYISLSNKLSDISASLIQHNLLSYLNNEIDPQIQDDNQATFSHMIKKEDGEIDWNKSAKELHHQIKAFVVWPSSFTDLGNIRVKINKARVVDQSLSPGQIFSDNKKLIIGTADKALEILELQPSGKKNMTASDFLLGYQNKL